MALAVDQAELDVIRPHLLDAIEERLAELAQDDRLCAVCSYPLTLGAVDICLCCDGTCACRGRTPPYNDFFRCEPQARIAWLAWQLAIHQARPSTRPFQPRRFPGDPAPPPPALRPDAGIFERLRQVDLSEYAGRFTHLTPAGPDRWRGRCPLHKERTGSFYVFHDDKGWRWHCFGACAQGGDIAKLEIELHQIGKA